jgi:hypothetical protein
MSFNGIVYDIEIIKGIPSGKDPTLEDIEYCEGWHDHKNMGISVIAAYDYVTGRFRTFLRDNFIGFAELLVERNWHVGFNNIGFDNKVLRASQIYLGDERSYDILAEMWRAADLDPTSFEWNTHGGYGLDETAMVNMGAKKSGHGALAPVQWQRGQYGAVIDYCLEDVRLTKRLMDRILANGFLVSPKHTDRVLRVRHPEIIEKGDPNAE